LFVSLINYCSSSSLFHCSFVVCKDGSCTGADDSCRGATIPYVVGPSCTGTEGGVSCTGATIGSVDSSCNADFGSCISAQLSGVDLINSCNAQISCNAANANGEIAELIDCCNDVDSQCQVLLGRINIVAAGGPGCVSLTCRTSDNCFFICQMTHSSLIHEHI